MQATQEMAEAELGSDDLSGGFSNQILTQGLEEQKGHLGDRTGRHSQLPGPHGASVHHCSSIRPSVSPEPWPWGPSRMVFSRGV